MKAHSHAKSAKGRVRRKSSSRNTTRPTVRTLPTIIRRMRAHLPELTSKFHIKSLGIFGSYLHGEQKPRSDLDLLIEFSDGATFRNEIEVEEELSKLLGVKVDLVPNRNLKRRIGKRILEEVQWLLRDGAPVKPIQLRASSKLNGATLKRKREYLDYIEDMLKSMENVQEFVAGKTLSSLKQDELLASATTWEVGMIARGAKRVPRAARSRHPEFDWQKFMDMRNRVEGEHFQINHDELWRVITQDIPRDKPRVAGMLEEEKRRAGEA